MSIQRSTLGGLTLGLLLIGWSIPAFSMDASSKEAVRRLANEGASAFEVGQFQQALSKFQLAYETARVPTLALWVAQTQVKLGHLVAAQESYRQALNLQESDLWIGTLQQQAQQQAQAELTALRERIPSITIRIEGAESRNVVLQIDGVRVPSALAGMERSVDVGKCQVVGTFAGLVVSEEALLSEGEHKEVVLRFPSAKPVVTTNQPNPSSAQALPPATPETRASSSSSQRTWGWIGVGVGAAGLAVGSTAGVLVALKYGKLKGDCPEGKCTPTHWDDSNSYARMQTLSTVGFVVGAVGAAAGVTLLLTSPKEKSPANVGLWVAPASLGMRGSF